MILNHFIFLQWSGFSKIMIEICPKPSVFKFHNLQSLGESGVSGVTLYYPEIYYPLLQYNKCLFL